MTKIPEKYLDNEDGDIREADPKHVEMVLSADVNSDNGRSQFCWVRLPNGDLVLGVFPQGETYEKLEMHFP
jgi:hypothetical protein